MMKIDELKTWPETRFILLAIGLVLGYFALQLVWQFILLFSDIFLVLLLAWLLAFILEPMVEKIQEKIKNRTVAAGLTFSLVLILLGSVGAFLLPEIINQFSRLIQVLPQYFGHAPSWLAKLEDATINGLGNSVAALSGVANFLFQALIVAILAFYLLVEKQKLWQEILKITPKQWQDELEFGRQLIDKSFASFLRIQMLMGVISMIVTLVVLLILRTDFAISAAILSGILTIIPVAGPFLALIPVVFAGFIASPAKGLIAAGLILGVQQIQFNILAPKMLGDRLKIHPAVVLLSFLIGMKIAGGWGALFAIPVVAILMVVAKQLVEHWVRRN